MVTQRLQGGGQAVDHDGRAAGAAPHHAVGQQRHAQHVVQVGMAEQDVVNPGQLVQREVTHAGAGVDQYIVIEQKGCGATASSDGARTAQNTDLHGDRGRRAGGPVQWRAQAAPDRALDRR